MKQNTAQCTPLCGVLGQKRKMNEKKKKCLAGARVDHSEKLKEFTEYLKTIPEIIGIGYFGSTATGLWDKYSDLDIDIVTKDKDYSKIVKMIPKLMEFWGEVKFWNPYETWDETYAFVGEDYFKVEIEPIKISYFKKPHFDIKRIKIVYDPTGKVAKGKKISQKLKKVHLDEKYFRWCLLDTRSNFFYIVRHYARGQKFHGTEEMKTIKGDLFKLLARLKGVEDYELMRESEKLFTKKELDMWKDAWCNSYEKRELKRSIKANWQLMKYVETKYEKISGKKLKLGTNDKEILEKVF